MTPHFNYPGSERVRETSSTMIIYFSTIILRFTTSNAIITFVALLDTNFLVEMVFSTSCSRHVMATRLWKFFGVSFLLLRKYNALYFILLLLPKPLKFGSSNWLVDVQSAQCFFRRLSSCFSNYDPFSFYLTGDHRVVNFTHWHGRIICGWEMSSFTLVISFNFL